MSPSPFTALEALPALTGQAAPIGIFDSGLGGLSVLRAIRAQLPAEALIYCADSRYAPYGQRDDDFIADRTAAIGDWLVAQGAKALVIACNTATAQTIEMLRERLALPLVGVEPGIKPAAITSVSRVAGVLATEATLRSDKFQRLLAQHESTCRFICQAGHGLVQAIERGVTEGPEIDALLSDYLQPMLDAGADTLVLGCTHYPFLDATIRRMAPNLTLIETGSAIARQLERLLQRQELLAVTPATHPPRFYSTGDGQHLRTVVGSLLHLDTTVERVTIASRRATALAALSGGAAPTQAVTATLPGAPC